MRIKLFTVKTSKVNGHDHIALVNSEGNGRTLRNINHVHKVENNVIVEENEHIHVLERSKK